MRRALEIFKRIRRWDVDSNNSCNGIDGLVLFFVGVGPVQSQNEWKKMVGFFPVNSAP